MNQEETCSGPHAPEPEPDRFSVGVEQVGDTLPESGQETDWGKAAPTRNLYKLP
jgi:hypothetical protein